MADLKNLLGDSYKEGMTFEEVNAALAERDLVDKSQYEGFVPKTLLEKANSEAADYKKKWKEASSEQERKTIEEAEHKAKVDEELKSLRRENKVSKYENHNEFRCCSNERRWWRNRCSFPKCHLAE